ncbi:MAG: mechanosensitive ion channel family protein [Thermoplasmata archaeon]|nr:mechanosensitive ion channel family protein [Thermoplasmata archaeon]
MATLLALIIGSSILIVVALLFFEGLGRLLGGIVTRAHGSASTVLAIRDTLRLVGVGVAAYGVVVYSGLSSELSLLTLSGVIGIIISLALQSTLSNLIAGVFLLRDRAIALGDLITISSVSGKVIHITLRNTWLLTGTGDVVVVSNSTLQSGPLINTSMRQRFRNEFPSEQSQSEGKAPPEVVAATTATPPPKTATPAAPSPEPAPAPAIAS